MSKSIVTYLHDHLAGARFAISLLEDLNRQNVNSEVAQSAARLLPAIEADRSTLEDFIKRVGDDGSMLKDVAAWVAQKAGRFKLTLHEPFGLFDAVEMLSLGVLGKVALWTALEAVHEAHGGIDGLGLEQLIARARNQHKELEFLRRRLAVDALTPDARNLNQTERS